MSDHYCERRILVAGIRQRCGIKACLKHKDIWLCRSHAEKKLQKLEEEVLDLKNRALLAEKALKTAEDSLEDYKDYLDNMM